MASSSLNPFAGEVALSPLPAGTSMRLTQDEAIAIAVRQLPAADGASSVIYVGYGMGRASYTDKADQPIWVVVVKANPSPHYGGPACDPTATCQPPLLVLDTAGAVVADRSGEVTRMFDQGHIASPEP